MKFSNKTIKLIIMSNKLMADNNVLNYELRIPCFSSLVIIGPGVNSI